MAAKDFKNNYIPEYIPDKFLWYKRDGLMTYIDKVKNYSFIKDTDSHFKTTQDINFDLYISRLSELKHLMMNQKNIRQLTTLD